MHGLLLPPPKACPAPSDGSQVVPARGPVTKEGPRERGGVIFGLFCLGWWFGRALLAPAQLRAWEFTVLLTSSSPYNHPLAAARAAPIVRFCASPSDPGRAALPPPQRPRRALGKPVPALEGAREVAKSRPHFFRARPAAHPSPRAAPARGVQSGGRWGGAIRGGAAEGPAPAPAAAPPPPAPPPGKALAGQVHAAAVARPAPPPL